MTLISYIHTDTYTYGKKSWSYVYRSLILANNSFYIINVLQTFPTQYYWTINCYQDIIFQSYSYTSIFLWKRSVFGIHINSYNNKFELFDNFQSDLKIISRREPYIIVEQLFCVTHKLTWFNSYYHSRFNRYIPTYTRCIMDIHS